MPPHISYPRTVQSVLTRLILPPGSTRCAPQPCAQPQAKAGFSTTPSRPRSSKSRRAFRIWIQTHGTVFRRHTPGSTNYIQSKEDRWRSDSRNKNRPFPLNPQFISEPVLHDKSRELIWKKVMQDGETVKAVSAELGVDIRRVAAVVRLKEVEKDWIAKGKKLATPYEKAVLSMIPIYTMKEGQQNRPFEPINELHVHPYTMKQIFWPTSESRHFTRADAAEAFNSKLLSADERVPHPELIQMEKEILQGRSLWDASERFKQAAMESERKVAHKQLAKAALEEKYTRRVNSKRFEFRFKQINSESVGPKGRARNVVGWRYGVPSYDRTKGAVKIPTSVP
ncbi:eukaryotic mitochondrial regulator protein-domain-containing protein [Hypoxylon sp. NC1633]|nr:eukaryotic mitochondrial regulator protein-domain-containing protein [Hypoxylon sp. NC1633]